MRGRFIKYLCTLFALCSIWARGSAQLKADFTIDKASGCSPLTVQFTNTTTGASTTATYKWDFGNGNTSGLPSPGATYILEKTYSVTLTVKDGANTSSKSQDVTVYKKPVVDFSVTPATGCLPLNVSLTSKATAGDGTISSYLWDFGDGQTQTGSNYSQISHSYAFAQKPAISLTVTNSYGCYATASKADLLNVSPAILPAFTASQTILCHVNDQASFTNTTTGPGALSYFWDFGDGKSSTDVSPVHTYSAKGLFPVTLTVKNAQGCSANISKTDYMKVDIFTVDFNPPTVLCTNVDVDLFDMSSGLSDDETWMFDGQQIFPNYSNGQPFWFFSDTLSHVMQLTHRYGTCTLSKTKTLKAVTGPRLNGFIVDTKGACTAPIKATLTDTTAGAVAWKWFNTYPDYTNTFGTGQSIDYTFPDQAFYYIGLQVTNKAGCTAGLYQTINLEKPVITISVRNSSGGLSNSGCAGVTLQFSASPTDVLKTYQWDFGDGGTATTANPSHTFNKSGLYTITLNYVTTGGCPGVTTYTYVNIIDNPKFDFSVMPDTVVCGNNPVSFLVSPQPTGWNYYWDFGDFGGIFNNSSSVVHQYYYDSIYTIKLIVQNGECMDTVTKKKYIRVKPDFPKIANHINTCEGTRGSVLFTELSTKVNEWTWDFGDGSNKVTYNKKVDTVAHTYTKTGSYNIVLTGINQGCSVSDSISAQVLIKQSPNLSSGKTVACGSDNIDLQLSNVEDNPARNFGYAYYITQLQYGDSTNAGGNNFYTFNQAPYNFNITGLTSGEKNLRVIIQSDFFYCFDTSNFMPLKITGPKAGFTFGKKEVCFKDSVTLIDTSVAGPNLPIKTWQWDFGDGTVFTQNTSTTTAHVYPNPGSYPVMLTVADIGGCTNTTFYNSAFAIISGPKANFTVSENPAPPNTTVYFYNNTNTYNAFDINYTWLFPDGTQSTDNYPSYFFKSVGADTVKLISSNNSQQCTDTAYQVIYIRNVNTAYTYAISYINNNNCPPVIVNFTSTTTNANHIAWNFGDGSQADNQSFVSHTYNNPGLYRVVLYGYDINNNVDSTEDFIEVKGPYAVLAADKLTGCDSLTVVLSATIKNASSFTWDFGDGTLQKTTDTFSHHQYIIPGVYTPELILKDAGGCSGTSALPERIVVDNIVASVTEMPAVICDSSVINFVPAVTSISQDQLQQPLQYHWNFGTDNAADTSNLSSPVFRYMVTGPYKVAVTLNSLYGCVQTVTNDITVQPVSRATISGPADICEQGSAVFSGAATNFDNTLGWNWQFSDNIASQALQNPLPALFMDAGTYKVTLIVNNNGCYDTAYSNLTVHSKPQVNILPQLPKICLGNAVQLAAHDATTYNWQPADSIDDKHSSSPFVHPSISKYYHVQATNQYGCVTNDSVLVTVDQPFHLKTNPELYICVGSKGQFAVSGANTYKWINGIGLSNTQIANPIVNTTVAGTYTVVGYDNDGCFTDTANIDAIITARPTVTASPHVVTINAGTDIQLTAQGSADVVKYAWQPADYLSCANCASPLSSPRVPVVYTVTATNNYGCAAADTIKINLVCAENLIYIPNAFTPNNDTHNDRFVIKGNGIKLIKHIAIFGRLGEKAFEKNNIQSNDTGNSWDGTIGGAPAPPGVYVYMAQIVCATGEVYNYKGTITLIR